MGTNDKQFQPERVDEDIEKLLQIQDQKEISEQASVFLVHEMKSLYLDETQILDRAWKRLTQQVEPAIQAPLVEEPISMQRYQTKRGDHLMKDQKIMKDQKSTENKHNIFGKRLAKIVLGFVAILVVASMIIIFTAYRQHPNIQTTAHQGTQQVTPPVHAAGGLYIMPTQQTIQKLDITQKGKVDWSYQLTQSATTNRFFQAENTLFVTFTDEQNDGILALDAATGKLIWKRTFAVANASKHHIDAVLDGSTLDLLQFQLKRQGADTNIFFALDVQTGATLHTFSLPTDIHYIMAANNILYGAGKQLSAYAASTGKQLWSVPVAVPDQEFAPPHLSQGIINIVSNNHSVGDGEVYGIKADTGAILWQKALTGVPNGTPGDLTQANNTVYYGIQGASQFYALDAQTGIQKWAQDLGGTYLAGTVLDGNTLYITDIKKGATPTNMITLNAETGEIIQYLANPGLRNGFGAYTVSNSILYTYIADASNPGIAGKVSIVAVTLQGETLWSIPTSGNWTGMLLLVP